jgi:NAD(P)-dependent dehydrogenase (short-subunit alcohol dehydrogenase family)
MIHSPENLMYQFNTNFLGTFKMTKGILPHFRERKSGKIIFVGSANGWRAAAGCGAYSVTKFALEGVTKLLVARCIIYQLTQNQVL